MHQRQAIREKVKATLVAASTAAGARVYETRMVPWRAVELPAISVYALSESVDEGSRDSAPRELKRTVEIAIIGAIKNTGNVDDGLDDLALQIETAMGADRYLGSEASDAILTSTEIGIPEDGDNVHGMVRLVYSVTYYTTEPALASAAPVPLKTVGIKYNLSGEVIPSNQAEDILQNLDV